MQCSNLQDDGVVFGLEPLDGIGSSDFMRMTNRRLVAAAAASNMEARMGHNDIQVHAVDTDTGGRT